MKTISRYIMTLALLITAVGGAWAQSSLNVVELEVPAAWETDESNMTAGDLTGFKTSTLEEAKAWKGAPAGTAVLIYAFDGDNASYVLFDNGVFMYDTNNPFQKNAVFDNWKTGVKFYYTTGPASEPTIDVTTNAASEQDLFTEAWFNMPTNDVTADYELVRDMQDETNPVAFSGLPTNDEPIIVKKGSDGKYQPAEALTIQLIDPLAAAEAQNIIAADGITVKVGEMVPFDIEGSTYYQLDKETLVPLADFLADMKPGLYKMVAESTDENSPYDGIVYSSQFTVVEQYDLTVKPANDFSKNGLDAVTVGSQSVTIDANTGEATKTGIAPDTQVKLKAKRGYIIEKVEAKKTVIPMLNAATTENTGMVVCNKGHLHDAKTAVPDGCTAVGIIGKVTDTGHGLILALKNATSQTWNTINGWASASYAGTTLKVLPDDGARGTNLTSYTTLGETTVSDWAVAQKSDYEAIFTNLGSATGDQDGMTYDGNVNAYITTGVGGTAMSITYWSATGYKDSKAWYFDSNSWNNPVKTKSYNVRPVLGF